MMTDDELPLRKSPEEGIPRNLELLSVEDLREYLVRLEDERSRVEAELARRQGAQQAAENVFRT